MNCCSASSASASVSVTRKSIDVDLVGQLARAAERLEKWPATRLRIERDLPT